MPELIVDDVLVAPSKGDLDQTTAVCPECLTRNDIPAPIIPVPVDHEGWGDRPRRIGPCVSCNRQLFYMPGDDMLLIWNLGD